jgi:hypothetical protein
MIFIHKCMELENILSSKVKRGSEKQRSHVFPHLWKTDLKDKHICICLYSSRYPICEDDSKWISQSKTSLLVLELTHSVSYQCLFWNNFICVWNAVCLKWNSRFLLPHFSFTSGVLLIHKGHFHLPRCSCPKLESCHTILLFFFKYILCSK